MIQHNNIRILYITHYTTLLGANRSLLQLMIEVRELGVQPTVLLPHGNDGISEMRLELEKVGIPFIETPIRSVKHPILWKVLPNYILELWSHKKIFNAIKGERFNLIHTNSSIICVGKYIAKRLCIKHVWHLREFGDADYNYKTPFSKEYQKFLYSGNNYFIAISKKVKEHFSRYISEQSIDIIYNGIRVPNSKKNLTSITNERIKICIVGILHENKGQLELLRALNELVNNREITNIQVNIIGTGEKGYVQHLQEFVNAHSLSEYVKFWGYQPNVSRILEAQDIGVMASSNEAFGRTTIEYMMAELCVICSDGGANMEIVEDGVSGLIYKRGSHTSLANKLECVIFNREFAKMLSKRGKLVAQERFTSDKNSRQIFNLYKKLLS